MIKRLKLLGIVSLIAISNLAFASDPLPSWQDNATKKAILTFVNKTTQSTSKHFVPNEQRIAVFDNDGTLWAEQPIYAQLFFAIDQVKKLSPQHPEWNKKEPFASLLRGDTKAALAGGEHAILEIIMASHAGMTTEQFEKIVHDWISTARHPKTNQPFTKMVYQPMLELIDYLKSNKFKVFIVSGGGIEFMRPWAESTYGIPPEQVIGSSIKTKYQMENGKPVLMRLEKIDFIDDKDGKPVGIHSHIGRRPIAAFGNSDGDRQMLEWTQAGNGVRLMMLVRHDDAKREWAYGPQSHIGTFSDELLAKANKNNWVVISMKRDWKKIFAFEQ